MNAKKLLGYALGPIGGAAFGLISLPLISWYFPADDIGRIVLLQTVVGCVLLVLGLGLDQAYIRDYYATENKAALFKAAAMLPLLLTGLLSAAAMLLFPQALPDALLSVPDAFLGLLCLIFLGGSLAARYLSLILRMQEKAFSFSLSQLAPKFLILVLAVVCVAAGMPTATVTLVGVYAAAQLLTVLFLIWQTRNDLAAAARAPWDKQLQTASMKYGIPLAFGYLAYWAFTSADRFVLKAMADFAELGIYSMSVSFGAIALVFQSIFSTIWAPMVFRWVEENSNLEHIGSITLLMTDLIAAIIFAVGIASPAVTWILPAQYAPVQFILLSSILFPLLYTLTEVTGIGINVAKKTWLITAVSLAALAANCALLIWLVPLYGAKGAAVSTAASFWLFFVLKTEASVRLWQQLPRRRLYLTTAACLACCTVYTLWGGGRNYFIFAAFWTGGLVWLYLCHRRQLIKAFQAAKGRLKRRQPDTTA